MGQSVSRGHQGSKMSLEDSQILCGISEKSSIFIWDDSYIGSKGPVSLGKYDWPES